MATNFEVDDAATDDGQEDLEALSTKRKRSLTSKAQQNFEKEVTYYNRKITYQWSQVKSEISKLETCNSVDSLRRLQTTICLTYGEYRILNNNYTSFLEHTRTEDGFRLLAEHLSVDKTYDEFVNDMLKQLDIKIQNIQAETRSSLRSSRSSRSSSRISSYAMHAKAKAKTAMIRMTIIEKEKELKKKQIDIEGDLKTLKEEQIYQEAKAEEEVYEQELNINLHNSDSNFDKLSINCEKKSIIIPHDVQDTQQRTREYVQSLPPTEIMKSAKRIEATCELNPEAKEFVPPMIETSAYSDLSKFLLKKDLLFSRLTKFDDKPENYAVWKASFQSVVFELGVSVREELDLLVKWLGMDSVKHAISLRASSSSNPDNGVRKLWDRLDERFGSAEIVELSLRKKIENFPNLGARDSKKLFELVDILDEIQNNMDNPNYKDLLSFYTCSLGVIPIVNKLPYNIQEKWTSHASRYKKYHAVPFPPFSIFTEFIREISKVKNDPGFIYEVKPNSYQNTQPKKKMSAMKTEVFQRDSRSINTTRDTDSIASLLCQFHNVYGHTLNSCRTFRNFRLERNS